MSKGLSSYLQEILAAGIAALRIRMALSLLLNNPSVSQPFPPMSLEATQLTNSD
jgi:hypothetical protein